MKIYKWGMTIWLNGENHIKAIWNCTNKFPRLVCSQWCGQTKRVDGMPTSEVTPVTIGYILTPHFGHQKVTVMSMNDPFLFNVNWPPYSWDTTVAFHFVAIGPFLVEIWQISYLNLKIYGQDHGQNQIKWSHLMPRIQTVVCFSFHGNRTMFGWVIENSIFDPENSRSRSCEGHIWWSHLGPIVQSTCLLYISWQSDHFWLRYGKCHIWP